MVLETIELDLHFSPCRQSQGILLKCRFWFGRPGRGLGLCISNKIPGDADAAGPQHTGNCKDNDSLRSLQSAFFKSEWERKYWTLTLLGSPQTFMETPVCVCSFNWVSLFTFSFGHIWLSRGRNSFLSSPYFVLHIRSTQVIFTYKSGLPDLANGSIGHQLNLNGR